MFIRKVIFGITLLLSLSKLSFAESCRYEVEDSYTIVSQNDRLFSHGTVYTYEAKKPKGQCYYLGAYSSPRNCKRNVRNEGYDCPQITTGEYTNNRFFSDFTYKTTSFLACWGCF